MALVTQYVVKVGNVHSTSYKKEHPTVATRQSTSVIKVSGQMHSDAFKRRLLFSFTVIILV